MVSKVVLCPAHGCLRAHACTHKHACACVHVCAPPTHIYMHYAPMQNRGMDMPLWKSKTNHSRYFFFLKNCHTI